MLSELSVALSFLLCTGKGQQRGLCLELAARLFLCFMASIGLQLSQELRAQERHKIEIQVSQDSHEWTHML